MTQQAPMDAAQVPDNDLLRTLRKRGTVRNFKADPIPDAWIDTLVAAGRRAPTSSNLQAYSVIVVRNRETKQKLAELANNQKHIADCPVFIAFCADLNGPMHACEVHGTKFLRDTLEKTLIASIDAALVGMTVSVAAETMGLGAVMIGAVRDHPVEIAKLLKLPDGCFVVFGLCLGWPAQAPVAKPRLPTEGIVHQEFYDASHRAEAVTRYDRELAEYYRAQQRDTPDQAWTQVLAEKFSKPRREDLRKLLESLGFGFK